jgi:energy-coupling factor transport system permease protein
MPLLSDITLGKYVAVDSPLHRLDPRTKFLATTALMMALLTNEGFAPLLLASPFIALAVWCSKVPPALVLKNLRPFFWLFFFTIVLHALLTPGATLWRLPYLDRPITVEGVQLGLFFSLRLAAVVLIASLLTLTTTPMELTDGLEKLLSPLRRFGFPAHELAMMVSIALRFIPVLVEEAERLHKAQLARGADFGGNPLRRVRNLLPLLVPLFISAFARADRLALAMESRCYRGGEGRTRYRELRFARGDGWAALLALLALLAICGGPRLWPLMR